LAFWRERSSRAADSLAASEIFGAAETGAGVGVAAEQIADE
jgi:hypothetical protein